MQGVGLAGLPVHVTAPDGTTQRRIIRSNSATTIDIYGLWTQVPNSRWTYRVGSVRYEALTGDLLVDSAFDLTKQVETLHVAGEPDTAENLMTLRLEGLRAQTATQSAVKDWNGAELLSMAGPALGLRARGAAVRLSGDNARPVTVIGLKYTLTEASK
jgi:hypothetical protein